MTPRNTSFSIVSAILTAFLTVPLLISCGEADARKVNTTINKKQVCGTDREGENNDIRNVENVRILTPEDSARWVPGFIFSGFDKTLTSSRESFFITNRSGRHLLGAVLEIDYLDMSGRQLHRRTVEITCDIPDGETRKADIPTFDLQHTFYYRLSPSPRRQATPFDVSIRILMLKVESG